MEAVFLALKTVIVLISTAVGISDVNNTVPLARYAACNTCSCLFVAMHNM
jgi:hypothetical protein